MVLPGAQDQGRQEDQAGGEERQARVETQRELRRPVVRQDSLQTFGTTHALNLAVDSRR
ncbi:hypothetical protein FMUAM8_09010 [Nocardia cyriacigeorgica]|nr:hypothetical protein FMUAM8_09010 [Nocardia cyriacigeorgica]BDU04773.1 hypothetical protein FMUBM48_10360 [Nocardia cyriacigeorgica]